MVSAEKARSDLYTARVEKNVDRVRWLLCRRQRIINALALEPPAVEFDEGEAVTCRILAQSEAEANGTWLREVLGLGSDPGNWYASDDFSSIKLLLRACDEGALGDGPGFVDAAEFDVYERLAGELGGRIVRESGHGDGEFVEYSISSDEGVARYCALEFYSNHNWNKDPANLFTVRFSAEILEGIASQERVRHSHPAKVTRRCSGGTYLVESLVMENDIEPKFCTERQLEDGTRESIPDTQISANRVMDNPIDFVVWASNHQKEIELL